MDYQEANTQSKKLAEGLGNAFDLRVSEIRKLASDIEPFLVRDVSARDISALLRLGSKFSAPREE